MAVRAMSLPALLLLLVVFRCLHALTPGVLDSPSEANEPNPRYIIAVDTTGGLCLYRIEEWWTFELCYKEHVRQFHKEQNQVVSEYSLGTFKEEVNQDEIKSGDSTGTRASRYISQMYTGGERCEIDGSEAGRQRSTEVRFMCSEDAKESITAIMEPSTCNYLLTVTTPRLCKHPEFRIQAGPVGFIVCRAAPEGEAHEQPVVKQQAGLEDHDVVQPPKDEL
eukprot:jgi/Astpho2/5197/Aster-04777